MCSVQTIGFTLRQPENSVSQKSSIGLLVHMMTQRCFNPKHKGYRNIPSRHSFALPVFYRLVDWFRTGSFRRASVVGQGALHSLHAKYFFLPCKFSGCV
jgi:hypothetical protein